MRVLLSLCLVDRDDLLLDLGVHWRRLARHVVRWSHLEMGRKYTAGIRTRVRTAVGPLFEMLHIYMVWLGFAKTHTYPVWGMTMLRQIRSPPAAPVSVLSH